MRILYLSNAKLPSQSAHCVQILSMCSAFIELGHTVTLFCRISKEYQVERIGESYAVKHLPYIECFTDYQSGISRIGYIRWLRRRISSYPRESSLIYSRFAAGLLAALPLKRSFIHELHSPPYSWRRSLAERLVFRSKYARSTVYINSALHQEYLDRVPSLKSKRTIVAHDGASEVRSIARSGSSHQIGRARKPNIAYSGSLFKGKGAEVVCHLAGIMPNLEFHIIGGSPDEFNRLANSETFVNLHHHGHLPHAEIPSLLDQMDILLLPAQPKTTISSGIDISRWMSPLKLFEYMASGKPIVSSSLPALREVLSHRVNALLCSPTEVEEWVSSITNLIENPSLANMIARQAKKDLTDKYTWERRAEKILLASFSK